MRPCLEPGCHALVENGRCRDHTRRYDQRRGSAHARGYTKRWAEYSRAWLRQFPLCGQRQDGQRSDEHSQCTRDGRIAAASCTDHIEPHRGDQQKFWDQANHQSLCKTCHDRKTVMEDGGFGR